MAWIRLTDNYEEDPKIARLSDGAFRLFHQVLAFCRRNQTDGLIPKAQMLSRPAYRSKRLDELMFEGEPGFRWTPLVSIVQGFGFRLNAYLKWNHSKDEENERREGSRDRMRLSRERRVAHGVAPVVACNTLAQLPDREGMDPEHEKKDPDFGRRASRLREELYPAWYSKFRHGARLRIGLTANSLEFGEALSLVQTWDDARLEKIARVILTTDDEFIAKTDRGWKIFVMKASWADDRLKQAEHAA